MPKRPSKPKTAKTSTAARSGRRGPQTVFPGKLTQPTAVVLTQLGRDAMNTGAKRAGMSRSDYADMLFVNALHMDIEKMAASARAAHHANQNDPMRNTRWHANPEHKTEQK